VDSHEVRRQWAERSGEFSPTYYAHHGPDERSEAVLDALERHLDRDARVLELGCSSGRHLSHLHDHGFTDLSGIELNPDAVDVMAEHFPDLADAATVHVGAIEDLVGEFADGAFDAVYSVETLQHIHPDAEWVFPELARITDDLLVTVENEGEDGEGVNHVSDDVVLHYRDWNAVFTGCGLVEVASREGERDTLRAFRVPES
jgi:SAM-dependent methyltransferase